jgi:N12 class adenine-specific DNA methylase
VLHRAGITLRLRLSGGGLDDKCRPVLGWVSATRGTFVDKEIPMAEASKDTHPDELRSDLDLLVEMVKDAKHDEQAIRRHLESLKTKLDTFIHKRGTHAGGSAS